MNKQKKVSDKMISYEDRRLALKEEKRKLLPFLFLFPLIVLASTFLFTKFPPIIIGGTAISALISFLIYHFNVGKDFNALSKEVKTTLIQEFLATYYPEVTYDYYPNKHQVKPILKAVNLIRADKYREEDVISGIYKESDFYFSEIHLENESRDKDGKTSRSTIFKGILFEMNIPNQNFPKTRIQSRRKLLQMLFSDFVKDEEYDFWYETEDEINFRNSMEALLPFISHLKHQQGDIRIQAEGSKVTLMMESKMKFLDDPGLSVDRSIDDSEYKTNIAKQLNTLLFIVDSFVNDLNNDEITKRLELKAIEMAELRRFNKKN